MAVALLLIVAALGSLTGIVLTSLYDAFQRDERDHRNPRSPESDQ
ncbi:hypothetical protein [Methylobacterium sp. BTF04]|nr:hypothetical protein [Methylobacterium sp. BTF04]